MHQPIYRQRLLPFTHDNCQTYGDCVFDSDGGVKLGNKWVKFGVPIHNYRFGANLIAKRRIDQPRTLSIECPDGTIILFDYSRFHRHWSQMIVLEDPTLYSHQQTYGTRIALLLFDLRIACGWLRTTFLHLLVLYIVLSLLLRICSIFD